MTFQFTDKDRENILRKVNSWILERPELKQPETLLLENRFIKSISVPTSRKSNIYIKIILLRQLLNTNTNILQNNQIIQDINNICANNLPYSKIHIDSDFVMIMRQFQKYTLRDIFNSIKLTDNLKHYISFQLIVAIKNLHSCDLFHGHITQNNVLVTSGMHVLLADHNIFKPVILDSDINTIRTYYQQSFDNECYFCPDKIQDNIVQFPKQDDLTKEQKEEFQKMDVFSLAFILYQIYSEDHKLDVTFTDIQQHKKGNNKIINMFNQNPVSNLLQTCITNKKIDDVIKVFLTQFQIEGSTFFLSTMLNWSWQFVTSDLWIYFVAKLSDFPHKTNYIFEQYQHQSLIEYILKICKYPANLFQFHNSESFKLILNEYSAEILIFNISKHIHTLTYVETKILAMDLLIYLSARAPHTIYTNILPSLVFIIQKDQVFNVQVSALNALMKILQPIKPEFKIQIKLVLQLIIKLLELPATDYWHYNLIPNLKVFFQVAELFPDIQNKIFEKILLYSSNNGFPEQTIHRLIFQLNDICSVLKPENATVLIATYLNNAQKYFGIKVIEEFVTRNQDTIILQSMYQILIQLFKEQTQEKTVESILCSLKSILIQLNQQQNKDLFNKLSYDCIKNIHSLAIHPNLKIRQQTIDIISLCVKDNDVITNVNRYYDLLKNIFPPFVLVIDPQNIELLIATPLTRAQLQQTNDPDTQIKNLQNYINSNYFEKVKKFQQQPTTIQTPNIVSNNVMTYDIYSQMKFLVEQLKKQQFLDSFKINIASNENHESVLNTHLQILIKSQIYLQKITKEQNYKKAIELQNYAFQCIDLKQKLKKIMSTRPIIQEREIQILLLPQNTKARDIIKEQKLITSFKLQNCNKIIQWNDKYLLANGDNVFQKCDIDQHQVVSVNCNHKCNFFKKSGDHELVSCSHEKLYFMKQQASEIVTEKTYDIAQVMFAESLTPNIIISACYNGNIAVIDTRMNNIAQCQTVQKGMISSACINHSATQLWLGAYTGFLLTYDIRTNIIFQEFRLKYQDEFVAITNVNKMHKKNQKLCLISFTSNYNEMAAFNIEECRDQKAIYYHIQDSELLNPPILKNNNQNFQQDFSINDFDNPKDYITSDQRNVAIKENIRDSFNKHKNLHSSLKTILKTEVQDYINENVITYLSSSNQIKRFVTSNDDVKTNFESFVLGESSRQIFQWSPDLQSQISRDCQQKDEKIKNSRVINDFMSFQRGEKDFMATLHNGNLVKLWQ